MQTMHDDRALHDQADTVSASKTAVFDAIRVYLAKAIPGIGDSITPDTPLLEANLLDSLGIIQLMTFLADHFQVEVSDEDFLPEHFITVGSLVNFVVSKQIPS